VFGTSAQRKKIPTAGGIDVTGAVVPFRDTVKLLGVTLDSALSSVDGPACYRGGPQFRPLLTLDVANDAKSVGHSIVSSRLDYSNALLHGTSTSNLHIYKQYDTLPPCQLLNYQVLRFVHKMVYLPHLVPIIFHTYFTLSTSIP